MIFNRWIYLDWEPIACERRDGDVQRITRHSHRDGYLCSFSVVSHRRGYDRKRLTRIDDPYRTFAFVLNQASALGQPNLVVQLLWTVFRTQLRIDVKPEGGRLDHCVCIGLCIGVEDRGSLDRSFRAGKRSTLRVHRSQRHSRTTQHDAIRQPLRHANPSQSRLRRIRAPNIGQAEIDRNPSSRSRFHRHRRTR
jgi:hypothetical protein